ncbi:hypothetical protein F2P44_08980 [Massilia sp. CCM 8695]|uniref:Uncharacterized protein n=1 Tax=Massilia frigida TaxID=2609281 RepID=A0ABX0N959_9BURK|nr:hypothetical protein [Massilia frigida]NHZ79409.1 hypothetical protein [Massilia frigida]
MSLDDRDIGVLIARLIGKYGSLDDPQFEFVEEDFDGEDGRKYLAMFNELGEIDEDTDINDDVSFGYLIKCDACQFYVRISMIKPYAFVRNLADRSFLHAENRGTSECSRRLVDLLIAKGLVVLGKDDLMRTVPLRIDGEEQVSIFRALFTDSYFYS